MSPPWLTRGERHHRLTPWLTGWAKRSTTSTPSRRRSARATNVDDESALTADDLNVILDMLEKVHGTAKAAPQL